MNTTVLGIHGYIHGIRIPRNGRGGGWLKGIDSFLYAINRIEIQAFLPFYALFLPLGFFDLRKDLRLHP